MTLAASRTVVGRNDGSVRSARLPSEHRVGGLTCPLANAESKRPSCEARRHVASRCAASTRPWAHGRQHRQSGLWHDARMPTTLEIADYALLAGRRELSLCAAGHAAGQVRVRLGPRVRSARRAGCRSGPLDVDCWNPLLELATRSAVAAATATEAGQRAGHGFKRSSG